MPINHIAEKFVQAYAHDGVFEGGLSFRKALAKSMLDSSIESLARIDHLLGKIHTRFDPHRSEFIQNTANVNFLHLLSYYIGHVIARHTGATLTWYNYDEMLRLMPDNADFFAPGFSSSITCVVSGGTAKAGFFAPLQNIEARLYEDKPQKSVASIAAMFMA